jgi:hypothetical protein
LLGPGEKTEVLAYHWQLRPQELGASERHPYFPAWLFQQTTECGIAEAEPISPSVNEQPAK